MIKNTPPLKKERTLLELYQIFYWYYIFNYCHENHISFLTCLLKMNYDGFISSFECNKLKIDLDWRIFFSFKLVGISYKSKVEFIQERIEQLK